jgi:hypothetical protein
VLPVVLTVVLAVVEIAVVARTQLELTAAAREGARVAATVSDPARAVTAARVALPEQWRDAARVTVSRQAQVGGLATVEVAVRHHPVTPLLDRAVIPLAHRSTMRVER